MSERAPDSSDDEALRREILELRVRVADLQRAAARYEEADQGSLAEREELLREAERVAHLVPGRGRRPAVASRGRTRCIGSSASIPAVARHRSRRSSRRCTPTIARAQDANAKSLREGVLPPVDCRIIRPDGSIRHTTSTSSMLFDASGVPRRIVGAVLDRTESRAVEVRLRRTLGLLEEAQHLAKLGSWRFVPQTGEIEWSKEFRRIAAIPPDAVPDLELFWQRVAPEDLILCSSSPRRSTSACPRSRTT